MTLINFALFNLVGKVLSPRIRDLGKITMVRDDTPTGIGKLYPHAGPLLSARWNEDLVADCWSDLLRMAGSLKYGQATASLIVGKWSASSRQNTLAAALKEWGTLRRTSRLCASRRRETGVRAATGSARWPPPSRVGGCHGGRQFARRHGRARGANRL